VQLLVETSEKRAVADLYTDRMARLPEFAAGEARAIACCPIKRNRLQFDSKIFTPKDPTDWIIQVALGGGFQLPVAGWWSISYGANTSETEIPSNPDADDIDYFLNNLDSVIAAGGVAVQGASGFFVFTFNNVGARTMLSGDPSQLVPLSLLNFERVVAGGASTQEVQILRIVQNAGTFATLSTNTSAPAVTFTLIQAGDATHNAKWRVTLPSDRYSGYWTFTKPAGATSSPIGYDDNEAIMQLIFEAIYGANNVIVLQETEDTFTVEHIGANTHTAMTIVSTTDATALKTILFKSGLLDLRVPGIDMMLNGEVEKIVRFEVQAADATGYPEKILQRDVRLVRPVLEPAMTQPQPQAVTFSGSSLDISVAAAGTTGLVPATPFIQWFQLIKALAGSGAYTRKITLDNTKAAVGAIFRIEIDFDASANPTIQIFDNTIAGTMIDVVAGDAGQSTYYVLEARFDGMSWKKLRGNFQT
jgi:hypothetical protein